MGKSASKTSGRVLPVRRPSGEGLALTRAESGEVTAAVVRRGNHAALQGPLPLPADVIGLMLQFCSVPDVLALLATCPAALAALPAVWQDVARARCGAGRLEDLERRRHYRPNYQLVAQHGPPFFFALQSLQPGNDPFADYVAVSTNGREVWSTRMNKQDTIVLADRPVTAHTSSAFTCRFAPVTRRARLLARHLCLSTVPPSPLRAAVGLTHLYPGRMLRPDFVRLQTVAAFFSLDGVLRKGGALHPARQPWDYGDDITVVVNPAERSCFFYVNGEGALSITNLHFDPGQHLFFFIRFGDGEMYHCEAL